jgi:hypothetical protein
MCLDLRKFFTWAQVTRKRCQITNFLRLSHIYYALCILSYLLYVLSIIYINSLHEKIKAGCGILAFQRFKSGGAAAFTNDGLGAGEDGGFNGGPAEPNGGYEDGQYNQPPFSGGGQSGSTAEPTSDRF